VVVIVAPAESRHRALCSAATARARGGEQQPMRATSACRPVASTVVYAVVLAVAA
jgi:hypothetical protein